jgi:hypothetical protein
MPTPATPQAPRSDVEAIDWANVAVETTVMLRLQKAPPVAAARGKRRDSATLVARIDAVKRKCATGYSCGASCISMNKVCRKAPGAGPAQQKMQRIL